MKSLLNHTISSLLWKSLDAPVELAEEGVKWQMFIHVTKGLRVLESSPEQRDILGDTTGALLQWHHLTLSYPHRLPDYTDIDLVRKTFIGEERECFQIFPRKDLYINVHPYTLHLFTCLNSEIFGDGFFSGEMRQ